MPPQTLRSDPCACGSGLRNARCCGLDESALPGAAAARHLTPLVERAVQSLRCQHNEVAARLCLEVLDLVPNQPDALRTLYRVRLAEGRAAAADALLGRFVRLHPNVPDLTCELARRLMRRGDLAKAEIHARNAVRIAPLRAEAHNILAMVLSETNRPAAGEHHYRRVLELSGARDPILLANLAWTLKLQGRMEAARALYEESAAAAPDVLQTLLGWARLEEADRQFAAAASLLDRAAALAPENPGVRLARAVLQGRMKHYKEAVALLDGMPTAEAGAEQSALGANESLEKGRLLDKLGRYDDAFDAFSQGKRLAREAGGMTYLDAQAQALASRLTGFFKAPRLHFTPRAQPRTDVPQPIFVLGFPRSGTTLLEQTLSAHPDIGAGDELPTIMNLTQQIPSLLGSPMAYPDALAELWMGDQCHRLDSLRDLYLQQAGQLGVMRPGAAWFTDKMPLNETHLGLIALMFPASPLIHMVRHPLDVVLSVFANHLTHGFRCAFALDSIARHYVLISDLVEQYRTEMALRYLPVRYEDMVESQAATVARVLAFIGVPFDPGCLRFEENRRYARTASYAQVSEKLYAESRFRYVHYRRHLEPVLPILRPVIARLGYEIAWEVAPEAVAA